jgi:hypothetical protein
MTDQNKGRRVRIMGSERSYRVYTVEPDGEVRLLPCRAVTISFHQRRDGKTAAEAVVYFTSPELDVEAPRASDGVRAG